MPASEKIDRLLGVLLIFLMCGTSVVFAKDKSGVMQKLTSKETSNEVAKEIPATSNSPSKQGKHYHSVGIGVGQTFLYGKYEDHGDDAITGDLFYEYKASHSFDMLVNAHYSEHKFKNEFVKLMSTNVGIKGRLYQFDAFSPFVHGGLGFYSPKEKRNVGNQLLESESKITFGIHFGAGMDLQLNRHVRVGVIGTYHNPFDVKQENGPSVEGSYFKLLITSLYTF